MGAPARPCRGARRRTLVASVSSRTSASRCAPSIAGARAARGCARRACRRRPRSAVPRASSARPRGPRPGRPRSGHGQGVAVERGLAGGAASMRRRGHDEPGGHAAERPRTGDPEPLHGAGSRSRAESSPCPRCPGRLVLLAAPLMGLSIGIVGLPNVGKSTLFNALSTAKAEAANYPFCTIEPNVGVVTVPDDAPRQRSTTVVHADRIVPATIDFVDIAGLVRGASQGRGARQPVPGPHPRGRRGRAGRALLRGRQRRPRREPGRSGGRHRDRHDRAVPERPRHRAEAPRPRPQDGEGATAPVEKLAIEICEALAAHLDSGKPARSYKPPDSADAAGILSEMHLLTGKPTFYIANVDEGSLAEPRRQQALPGAQGVRRQGRRARRPHLRRARGADRRARSGRPPRVPRERGPRRSRASTRWCAPATTLLGLITYFTAGKTEVRAWTIKRGWKAPQAAGVIHTDFEKGFIKAEVIWWEDFVKLGGEAKCREAGKLRHRGQGVRGARRGRDALPVQRLRPGVSREAPRNQTRRAAKLARLATESARLAAKFTPLATESARLAAKSTPLATESARLAAKSTPLATESAPLAAKSTPLATESAPLAAKSTPLATESAPLAAKSTPLATESARLAAKLTPLAA